MDSSSPGNYGLMDVIKALEFIQKYIDLFGGDPTQVTLAGTGSGASMASLLVLSPKSKNNNCEYEYYVAHISLSCA